MCVCLSVCLSDYITAPQSKTQMLDNLLEIEITYSLLKEQIKSDVADQRDPLDINYEKLKTDFDVSISASKYCLQIISSSGSH